LLAPCTHPGCGTLTIGRFCVGHEAPVVRTFPRGRPYRRNSGGSPARAGIARPPWTTASLISPSPTS